MTVLDSISTMSKLNKLAEKFIHHTHMPNYISTVLYIQGKYYNLICSILCEFSKFILYTFMVRVFEQKFISYHLAILLFFERHSL